VFTRFIILEWIRRKNSDYHSLGEIFFLCYDDVRDIELSDALDKLVSIIVDGLANGTVQMDEYEDFLRKMAERYPEHTSNIMIEITEQASLQIDEAFVARLTRVKEMGYRLAIDDFGMGNTSVKYLRSNVFDMIKLDGSLIQDIESNERSQGIVRNMVNMAQEFRIDILAEFVETREQQELLDCHLYQGYLYSPAVPLEKFLE
jgi:EAL domain-containing protein (putative c-di-GMP-specific phosphodiesterase class I)